MSDLMPSSSSQDTPVTSWCMKRQRLVDYDSDADCPVPIDDIETDRQIVVENKNLKPGKRFQKTDDDAVPLPDPFPLPKNYKTDVNVALKTGKMTRETKKQFFLLLLQSCSLIKGIQMLKIIKMWQDVLSANTLSSGHLWGLLM